jgi:hypothetical protein
MVDAAMADFGAGCLAMVDGKMRRYTRGRLFVANTSHQSAPADIIPAGALSHSAFLPFV